VWRHARASRKHCDKSETGILRQHARTETQIPQQYFKYRKPAPLANYFWFADRAKLMSAWRRASSDSFPHANSLRCASGDGFPSRRKIRIVLACGNRRPFEKQRAQRSMRIPSWCEEAGQNFSGLLPLARFFLQLLCARRGELVILGFTIVVGGAPFEECSLPAPA